MRVLILALILAACAPMPKADTIQNILDAEAANAQLGR